MFSLNYKTKQNISFIINRKFLDVVQSKPVKKESDRLEKYLCCIDVIFSQISFVSNLCSKFYRYIEIEWYFSFVL